MLMNHFGQLNMNKTKMSKNTLFNHYITGNIEERNNKLEAVSFSGQYGDKVSPKLALVHPNFKGDVVYQGNSELTLSGEFRKEFKPIASWQNNLVYDKDKVIQIWPEFDIDGAVEFAIYI
ncbi:Putative cytosolic protein [Staphylococcus aureus]|uniref:Cytosolic protein n=1 Tax=Staphylococcus aureus TaxID=1280 RepID=A0A380ENV9_STAAU|nr:Putative cytosolic protein [Staphylococcus aureus]